MGGGIRVWVELSVSEIYIFVCVRVCVCVCLCVCVCVCVCVKVVKVDGRIVFLYLCALISMLFVLFL